MEILLTLLPTILQFMQAGRGSSNNQVQGSTTTTTSPPTRYESPMRGYLDMIMTNLMGQNVKRTGNMGYPKGQGLDTSWIDQLMGMIGPEFGKMIAQGKEGSTTPVVDPAVDLARKYKECVANCMALVKSGPGAFAPCFANCERYKPVPAAVV